MYLHFVLNVLQSPSNVGTFEVRCRYISRMWTRLDVAADVRKSGYIGFGGLCDSTYVVCLLKA